MPVERRTSSSAWCTQQIEPGPTPNIPTPKWQELFLCSDTAEISKEEGQKKGELLCSFQLIPKRVIAEPVRPSIEQVSEWLLPEYRTAWLDILAWGVRDLRGGSNPFVRFDLIGADGSMLQYRWD